MCAKLRISVILVCLYLLAVLVRVFVCQYHVSEHSPFMPFTGESALLYRYAEIIAEGREVPELDYVAQYPEGLAAKRQLSFGWEFIAGKVYQLFFRDKMTFHSFARYFTSFFFCISVISVFLIIKLLSGDDFGSVVGTLFYAVSLPAVIRATGQEISRENFCLPLLFFHIYLLTKYMRDKKLLSSILAGVFLFISLAFWEGAQVYFYIFVIFMVLLFVSARDFARLLPGFTIITAFAALAGMFIPYLRAHFFITSYPMLVAFSLVGTGFLTVKRKRTVRISVFILFLLMFFLVVPHSGYGRTYSHMQSLLWYKLRFLNEKPEDPNLLPYDVRILWTPALTKPGGRGILFHFSTLIPLCIASVISVIVRKYRRGIGLDEKFVFLNLIVFSLLYLMFKRMEVFLVFFVCIFIGRWFGTKKRSVLVCSVVCLCILFEGSRVILNVDRLGRPVDYHAVKDLLSWTKENTPEEAVILSHFNISPVISLYTGRKIVLHPKFESPLMRDKVKKYLYSLFSTSQDAFYSFCHEVDADFIVYPKGTFSTVSRYSWRYMTATCSTDFGSNAYMFEYMPACLRKFGLLYDNGRYMVYKIYKPDEIELSEAYLEEGNKSLRMQLYGRAIREYTRCIEEYPKYADGYARLGTAYHLSGEKEKAMRLWEIARRMKIQQD